MKPRPSPVVTGYVPRLNHTDRDFHMRPSNVLKKLRRGEVVNCVKLNVDSARIVELAATFGADCVWLDNEHTTTDWSVLEKQIYAAKAFDCDVLVRTSRGGYSDYVRPLELDATGIMVPHIMSADDARFVARTVRFHPIGRRPADGGNADGRYCNVDFLRYIEEANRERFVIIQIEDPEPLDELDAIAAVEGIDMLFFGPGDFSHGIGAPAQWEHPRLLEARRRIVEAARRHGKFAGTVGSPAAAKGLADMGYQFINLGSDVVGLSAHFKTIVDQFHATVTGPQPAGKRGAKKRA